jgi:hypothetical protein
LPAELFDKQILLRVGAYLEADIVLWI